MKIAKEFAIFFLALILVTATISSAMVISAEEDTVVLVHIDEPDDLIYLSEFGEVIDHYGRYVLLRTPEHTVYELEKEYSIDRLERRFELHVKGHDFDRREGIPDIPSDLTIDGYEPGEEGLYIVQMLGPVNSQWRLALEDEGVNIINYVRNFAYEVSMTPEQAEVVEDLFFVDWVGIYQPAYKLNPDAGVGLVNVRLRPGYEVETLQHIASNFNVIGGEDFRENGYRLIVEIDSESDLKDLAMMNDVYYISPYVEPVLHDEMATQIIGGGLWIWDPDEDPDSAFRMDTGGEPPYAGEAGSLANQLGYTGDGVTIAVADTGIGDGTEGDAGHDDFTGRVVGGYGFGEDDVWSDGHGHGTHCTGSAAGDTYEGTGTEYYEDYYAAQGSAPLSELFAVKIFDDGGGFIPTEYYPIVEEPAQRSDSYVHTNSWGAGTMGSYSDTDEVFDQAVRDADRDTDDNVPMVITVSAGNDGGRGDFEQETGSPGNSKNVITVGASENYNPNQGLDNPENIAGFSSRGWTEDNRVKPDVQAPGDGIYSTMPGGGYDIMSGTSMSNPAVAGAAAVVIEWYEETYGYRPSPAMVKALLINTAYDMDPNEGDSRGYIPNQDEGWGMVNLPDLVDSSVDFIVEDQSSLLETGDEDEYILAPQDVDEPFKISLTWTDENAMDGDSEGGTPTLKNNLDLEVETPGGEIIRGNAFDLSEDGESDDGYTYPDAEVMADFDFNEDGWDDVNNVQNVYIPPDDVEAGTYTIYVHGTEVPEDANNDGTANQDYALVVQNAAAGPTIELERPLGGEYWEVGAEEDIIWETSEGAGQITDVDLEYSTDGGDSWEYIVEGHDDTGSYSWLVPDETTDEAVIRATVHDDEDDTEEGTDTSGEFTITDVTPPDVDLDSPVGGEEWHAGEVEEILWSSTEGDEPIVGVDIEYTPDGGITWETIVEGTDDTGSYSWEIPDVTTSEALVRVWVNCAGDTSGDDVSDDYFDLIGYPPEPPENLEVDHWSLEQDIFFEDDVSEDKGYTTDESHAEASDWDIRDHGSSVGDQSWDWGDGQFNKDSDEGMLSWLISPEIEVPGTAENVELTFEHWRDFGDDFLYDAGNLKISTDGVDGPWNLIVPEEGYDGEVPTGWGNPLGGQQAWGGVHDWETATFDLSDHAGESIHLRWDAGTEAWEGLEGAGWRVDDIILLEETPTGTDHNLLTWDASPGDLPDDLIDSQNHEELQYPSSKAQSLYETENTRSQENDLMSNAPVEHDDDWYSLYGHVETEDNDVEWRYDMGNAVGWGPDAGTWYSGMILDLSDHAGLITDVAYYDTPLIDGPNVASAVAHIGIDDDGAPAEPFLSSSETYDGDDEGWIELELDEPVDIDPNEDYWIVMELEDLGDGHFPQGFVHDDDADPEDPAVEYSSFISELDADPHDPASWNDDYPARGAYGIEARITSPDDPFFVVDINDYDEEVEPGDQVTVDYTITNIGGEEGTQDIEFRVEGILEDTVEDVTLDPDQEYEDEFVWQTDDEHLGIYSLQVSSEDNVDEVIVMVGDTKIVTHYNIYRAEDEGGPFEFIAEVDADASESYTYVDEDRGGADPTIHWYIVRAVSEDGVEEQNEIAVPEPGLELDIILNSPIGGEVWQIGSDQEITWDSYSGGEDIVGIDLDYSTDGGATWTNIEEGLDDTGSYTWTVPDEPTEEAVVRATVHDEGDDSASDESDYFTILDDDEIGIELTSPEGGETWIIGEEEDIEWQTYPGGEDIVGIDLDYSTDGGATWTNIEEGLDDTGSYTWTVPDEPTEEAVVRATVHDEGDDSASDESGFFTILDDDELDVDLISPTGGETWIIGEEEDIEWQTYGEDIVGIDLDYSADGGGSWTPIAQGLDDTGSYTWEIPDDPSTEALVQVTVHDTETSVSDVSDGYFTITDDITDYPNVNIFSPSDGEITEDEVQILWDGYSDTSDIDYYEVYDPVAEEWIDVGLATWYVFSDLPDGEHTVEVRVTNEGGLQDTDSVTFVVDTTTPEIEITSPEEDAEFGTDEVTVEWTGTSHGTEIEYYTVRLNGGAWMNVEDAESYDFIGLQDSTHYVDVRAVDEAGHMSEDTVTFYVDTSPPPLEITSPEDGIESLTYEEELLIAGTTDPDATVEIDGVVVDVDEGGEFSHTVHLVDGLNLFQVVAYDEYMNTDVQEVAALYLPDIQELWDEIGDIWTDIDYIWTDIGDIVDEVDELQGDVEDLDQAVSQLQGHISDINDELTTMRDEIDQLQDDLKQAEEDIKDLQTDLQQAEEDIDDLQTDMEAAMASILELESQVYEVEEELNTFVEEQEEIDVEQDSGIDMNRYFGLIALIIGILAVIIAIIAMKKKKEPSEFSEPFEPEQEPYEQESWEQQEPPEQQESWE